jgi:hypothetical protein
MSELAAMSAGLLPGNIQPTNAGINRQPRALLEAMGAAGAVGTFNPSVIGNISIMNQSTNGAVGNNFDAGRAAGSFNVMAGQIPANIITTAGSTFQG